MSNNLKAKIDESYRIILDNLLDISPNDNSIFCRVDNREYFDVLSKFGYDLSNKIYNQVEFDIPVIEYDTTTLINKLTQCQNVDEIIDISTKFNNFLYKNYLKDLKKDFQQTVKKMVDNLEVEKQKSSSKWKLFLNKAENINSESNIWSMYIGFMFITLSSSQSDKKIHAPLFLKEVKIELRNSNPYLISDGTIKLNEKLFYFLQNEGFTLDVNVNLENMSIADVIKNINETWKSRFEIQNTILGRIGKLSYEDITNEKIMFHKGMILGIFQPLGGYLRNRMIDIIEKNDLDSILDVEFNKNIYSKRINETLLKNNFGFLKITPSNYSQDKAIVSSLNQNTIIWGPPGTGKSQTIVNILANIIAYQKTALVVSQKRAALDVIEKRMGKLSKFCLFLINNMSISKENFYKPIENYINMVENIAKKTPIDTLEIISNDEKKYVMFLNLLAQKENYFELLKINGSLIENDISYDSELFDRIRTIDDRIKFPQKLVLDSKLKKQILKENNISSLIKIGKKADLSKAIDQAIIIIQDFNKFSTNFNDFVELIKKNNNKDIESITRLWELKQKIGDLKEVNSEQEIENYVIHKIFNKINHFSEHKKRRYKQFATVVRLSSMGVSKFLKEFADIIKDIFPVIVTTPDTDLSSWDKEEFDYGIMDECSQLFIEKGLPVLYLSKIKILAGDNQQMRPTRWFTARNNSESIFGKHGSLLDYAMSLGIYKILLDKNYRSNYASLMTFSSKQFYESNLDIVDLNQNEKQKSIELIEANGEWQDSKNQQEIDIVINLAIQNLSKFKKIIILTFNASQMNAIQDIIFDQYPQLEDALSNNSLLLKNIENIQGEEADLVIISVVYDKNIKIHSTYVGRENGKNALNVAISRAKDKMIVVKSIASQDINNTINNSDARMFRDWLRFLELDEEQRNNYIDYQTTLEIELNPTQEFSELFLKVNEKLNQELSKYDIELKSDYIVGTQKVDIAIFNNQNIYVCGIKIDDNLYKDDLQNYISFVDKVKFLNIKNYDIIVVDNLIWYSNLNEIINHIKEKLGVLENTQEIDET